MSKINYALISTLTFALLSVLVIYFAREFWESAVLSTSPPEENSTAVLVILAEYCLISGFLISLAACINKGFRNLKDLLECGLIFGLFAGLIYGLFVGVLAGTIAGLVGGLLAGLNLGLVIGVVSGNVTETSEKL